MFGFLKIFKIKNTLSDIKDGVLDSIPFIAPIKAKSEDAAEKKRPLRIIVHLLVQITIFYVIYSAIKGDITMQEAKDLIKWLN